MSVMSSFQRVFDIPELVDLLLSQCDKPEVSILARTNRTIRRSCTPWLYKSLDFRHDSESKGLDYVPGMVAFGRNVRHVKDLTVGPDELAFYYNCVLDFEEIHGRFRGSVPTTSRPAWFPPPDSHTCQVLALPPMTNLSQVTLEGHSEFNNPHRMRSAQDPRAILGQLCWLISLNPHLTYLNVNPISIKDPQSGRRLVEAVAGLQGIRELGLWIECRSQDAFRLGMDLFYSVKPSIRSFVLSLSQGGNNDGELDQEGLGVSNDGLMVMPRRQEPLVNLETLALWGLDDHVHVGTILSILGHCPNIIKLGTFDIDNEQTVSIIADFVGRECSRIRKLNCSWDYFGRGAILPFKIMEALPAQQVTEVDMCQWHSIFNQPIVGPAILRHSTTLRSLNLRSRGGIARMPAAAIFENCLSLESFQTFEYNLGLYANLDDVQGAPWKCSNLRELSIAFSGCELPFDHDNPDSQPYYARPAPIVLSEAEVQHFARLERLYWQVGQLTQLRYLQLVMVKPNEEDQLEWGSMDVPKAFPALMTLGDVRQGRPGYLNHLAELKELEMFAGSIDMDNVETKVTSEWREAVWMYEHWPRLQKAYIFSSKDGVSAPFEWLKDKYIQDGKKFTFFEDAT